MASFEGQQSEVVQRFRKALSATASRQLSTREAGNFDDVFDDGRVPKPAGLAYSPNANEFILLPAQSNRFQSELSSITLDRDPLPGSDKIAAVIDNPINTVFDPKFNRWIGWNSKGNQLVEVSAKADGNLDATKLKLKPKSLGIQDSQGITVNPTNGDLFFLDSKGKKIVRLQPAANGMLDAATATLSQIPLPGNIASPRGIAFNATTGNLHLLSPSQKTLYELSQTGQIVNSRDVSRFNLKNPQSLTFAPSGDRTDNPQEQSLYVADSDANSTGIVELSFTTTTLASSNAQLYYVRTLDASQFDPPSPDSSGIAYFDPANTPSGSDRFLIADGEVDEIPTLFTGDNYFEFSLPGTLSRTGSSVTYSSEPTGVDLNPANGHLFVSDDNADKIFEVIPGGDGFYGSADDTVVGSFSTRPFGSFDPEGVAFGNGSLFIADGLNSEVYQVTTSGTLVSQFDTESLGIIDPEGIEYDPESGHLYLQGHPNNVVGEVTTNGTLVQMLDTSAANARKPAGLAIGANSIVPGAKSLYIVDRGVDNNADPNENDGKVYEFSFAPVNQPPVVNAGADLVVIADASLDGTVSDDGHPDPPNNVTISWSQVSGAGTVTFLPANAADTVASFSDPGTYQLRLTADDSELSSRDDLTVVALSPQSTYFISSSNNSGSVGGVFFADEDVLAYDSLTGNWWKYFDGSDVGLTASSLDLDALYINPDGSILLSVDRTTTIPNLGAIEDTDIVRFVPTATGETTAGTYEWYFDGSDVGLDNDNEDIDAIGFAPDGRLAVSTRGSFNAGGISGQDEDLFAFDPTTLGASTSGTWSMYFDGSDVGLGTTSSEDVDAVWIDPNGTIHLSTEGAFSVTNLNGDEDDISQFVPISLGDNTNGTFSLFWNGSANGITSIDGFARV